MHAGECLVHYRQLIQAIEPDHLEWTEIGDKGGKLHDGDDGKGKSPGINADGELITFVNTNKIKN